MHLSVDPSDLSLRSIDADTRFHPEAVHLLRIGIAEFSEDRRIKHTVRSASSTRLSSSSLRMLTRLSQVPLLRAVEQPILS